MKITKYEHACLVIEENGSQLIVDPSELSHSFVVPENPVAIVITHIHGDHFDKSKVTAIKVTNPNVKIFTIEDVAKELQNTVVVADKFSLTAGPFKLDFYGVDHAIVHPDAPRFKNTGVMINDILFYPGDSFTVPEKPVEVLAVPTSGPWLKTGESIDYMLKVNPKVAFATHDAVLSEDGALFTNSWLTNFASKNSIEYKVLKTGETLEI